MERRDFLKMATAATATLAAQGHLPLLAAERKTGARSGLPNCFTEPCAIESITGYLPQFSPAPGARMNGAFHARYTLIACSGSAGRSHNHPGGSLELGCSDGRLHTTEKRANRPANIVRQTIHCDGPLNTASKWTLDSSIEGQADLSFHEDGTWDGKQASVTAKSWTQQCATVHPLIARWALLPLLASGRLKGEPLRFDLLDDSAVRPDQVLRYAGEIEVPVKDGTVPLDSYVQTGRAIVPTHYLVDRAGRVQLITMSQVNWALQDLGG